MRQLSRRLPITTMGLFSLTSQPFFLKFDILLKRTDDRYQFSPLRFLQFKERQAASL